MVMAMAKGSMGSLEKAKDHPWLALPHQYHQKPGKSSPYFMSFQSVLSNRVYHLQLPEVVTSGNGTICGSSSGFLIMVDQSTSQITMIDPLSKSWFNPPPISTSLMASQDSSSIDNIIHAGREKPKYFVHKAVLSSRPDCNHCDYILMVIYGDEKELAYYNARTQTWTNLQEAGHFYDDIIFHNGGFYAVNGYGKVVFCRPAGGNFPNDRPYIEEIATPWHLRGNKVYLVGIGDCLCVVIRFSKEDPDLGYETFKFEVHLWESYDEWRQIRGLADWALFLGRNHSVALLAQDFKGLKGNCIYFTDDHLEPYKYGVNNIGGHDFGLFDMEEQSFQPLLQSCNHQYYANCSNPVWLTPDYNGFLS